MFQTKNFLSNDTKQFIIEGSINLGDYLDDILLLSVVLLMGVSVVLFLLNIYTYKVTKNKKVLIISGIFILFFIQALLVFLSEFWDSIESVREARILMLIDLLVVLVIYLATVKSS